MKETNKIDLSTLPEDKLADILRTMFHKAISAFWLVVYNAVDQEML